jgi:hypothetical protein
MNYAGYFFNMSHIDYYDRTLANNWILSLQKFGIMNYNFTSDYSHDTESLRFHVT